MLFQFAHVKDGSFSVTIRALTILSILLNVLIQVPVFKMMGTHVFLSFEETNVVVFIHILL